MKLLNDHLTQDAEGVAVLAFDAALCEGVGPRAAMHRAFDAAGVVRLADRADALEGELAEVRAALKREQEARRDASRALAPLQPLTVAA
jgi:hypothetical protein